MHSFVVESPSNIELERPTSGGSKAESLPRQFKTISSAVVDRALRKLRASKMELVKALEKGGPSNLNNESITEQENDVANPSGTNTAPGPSLMERRSTAHTYEVNLHFVYCFIISSMLFSSVLSLNS